MQLVGTTEGGDRTLCKHSVPRIVTTREICVEVMRRLLACGIRIHRLDAKTSDTVYLLLDCGALGGIRISDHPARPNSNYRYNIGSFVETNHTVHQPYERHFFTETNVGSLANMIVADRREIKSDLGDRAYASYVADCENDADSTWMPILSKGNEAVLDDECEDGIRYLESKHNIDDTMTHTGNVRTAKIAAMECVKPIVRDRSARRTDVDVIDCGKALIVGNDADGDTFAVSVSGADDAYATGKQKHRHKKTPILYQRNYRII